VVIRLQRAQADLAGGLGFADQFLVQSRWYWRRNPQTANPAQKVAVSLALVKRKGRPDWPRPAQTSQSWS